METLSVIIPLIERTLYTWVQTEIGIDPTYQFQNIPHNDSPSVYLNISNLTQIHDSEYREAASPTDDGDRDLLTNWEFDLQVQGFGFRINPLIADLKNSLNKIDVHQTLKDGGLITWNDENTSVVDISGIDGSENEERCEWETRMRFTSLLSNENLGVIESANIEGSLDNAGEDIPLTFSASVLPVVNSWEVVADPVDVLHNHVYDLLEFNGNLFGAGGDQGRLFQWDESSAWVQKAGTLATFLEIRSLVDFSSELWAGGTQTGRMAAWDNVSAWTSKAFGQGSSGENQRQLLELGSELYGVADNGRLYKYNGTGTLEIQANALVNYKLRCGWIEAGEIYAAGQGGCVLKWDGISAWVTIVPNTVFPTDVHIWKVIQYKGNFYGITYSTSVRTEAGRLVRLNGATWDFVSQDLSVDKFNDLIEFGEKLYVCGEDEWILYKWDNIDTLSIQIQNVGEPTGVEKLYIYNNRLFGGTEGYLLRGKP